MTSQEANSIPLEDILSRYGYEPSRRYGGYDMYRSPFRCDSSPSFKVFRNENRWYDFGDSSHGRVVDLVMRIQNCSFPQAMKEIEGLGFSSGMIPQPRPVPVTAQKASGMTLLKIIPVENGHPLPGYVYLNATTGTGATRTVFIFQVITTIAYLFCLWGLGYCNVTLAAYWAVEYLYVILLGTQSVIYLKYKQY